MKSPMISSASYIKDKGRYTDLQVCRSAAGFYIGTMYTHPEYGEEPASRDSDYFETREAAEAELALLNRSTEQQRAQLLRATPDEVTPVAAQKKREAIERLTGPVSASQ